MHSVGVGFMLQLLHYFINQVSKYRFYCYCSSSMVWVWRNGMC